MSKDVPAEGASDAEEARDAWLEVSDDLLAGVGHALSNRVAAMTAVGQVLAATAEEGPFTGALATESTRLQHAVQLLRLLVRRWEGEPEPIQLDDVLGDVAELLSHHPEVRHTTLRVQGAAGLAPVWTERSMLTHSLCILLAASAEAVEHAGEPELAVRCSGTLEELRIQLSYPSPPPCPGDGEASEQPPGGARVDPRSARGLLRRCGGELSAEEEGGRTHLLLRLPTLMEVRRRERQG